MHISGKRTPHLASEGGGQELESCRRRAAAERTPTQLEENPISMSLTDLSQDGGMNRQGAEALS
jgi:hypothetical protein